MDLHAHIHIQLLTELQGLMERCSVLKEERDGRAGELQKRIEKILSLKQAFEVANKETKQLQ